MGMFSWLCAKCKKPVLGSNYQGYNKFRKIAVLFEDGGRVYGTYDGYGRLEERGIEFTDAPDAKLVHRHCYEKEDYAELGSSPSDPDQGFGRHEAEMIELYGEPDLSECTSTVYVCTTCKRTFKSLFSRGVCAFGCKPFVCPEHGPQTKQQAHEQIRSAYRAESRRLGERTDEIAKEQGISRDQAHNVAWAEMKDQPRPDPCGGCRKQVQETVLDMALPEEQALVTCLEPECSYHGRYQLRWKDFGYDDAGSLRCETASCAMNSAHRTEMVTLDRSAENAR